jgi:hypothetical protein
VQKELTYGKKARLMLPHSLANLVDWLAEGIDWRLQKEWCED